MALLGAGVLSGCYSYAQENFNTNDYNKFGLIRASVAETSLTAHSVTTNSDVEMSIQARPMRSVPEEPRARAIAAR